MTTHASAHASAGAAAGALPSLVSPEWLQANLKDVKVLDGTWYLPNMGKDPLAEHKAERIPGAIFFGEALLPWFLRSQAPLPSPDACLCWSRCMRAPTRIHTMLFLGNLQADLDRIADPSSSLPHMLPSERQFAAAADALGITPDDALVVYDNAGIFSSARVWWTWHVFGHPRCAAPRAPTSRRRAGGAQLSAVCSHRKPARPGDSAC